MNASLSDAKGISKDATITGWYFSMKGGTNSRPKRPVSVEKVVLLCFGLELWD